MNEAVLDDLQRHVGYAFRQSDLLLTALTHSSYANEKSCSHNERLEFLGDAVLELVVSAELYARYPEAPEGVLTKMRARLVSLPSLAAMARELGLERCLFLGKGEESQGGRLRDSLLSDAFEALLGAMFEDGGFEAVKTVVLDLFKDRWPSEDEPPRAKDFKSQLQELTQRHYKARPVYRLAGSFGPEHDKRFEVSVDLPSGMSVSAQGASVKKAEQAAAQMALELLADPESDQPG
ncbi:ribonuclease III [Fundidesulfovibrio butyratiphilus]